jgi:hypothetical protein
MPTFSLQIVAATSGLIAGVFFCVGAVQVKQKTLECLAITFWGPGRIVATQLAEQKVDYCFGAGWFIFSFVAQLTSIVFQPSAPTDIHALLLGGSFPVALLVLSYFPWRVLRRRSAKSIDSVVAKDEAQAK